MTTNQDLGKVAGTRTEWTNRIHYANGEMIDGASLLDEAMARFSAECVQSAINGVAAGTDRFFGKPATAVDLVSRTVTEYADGHRLIGPWEVTG